MATRSPCGQRLVDDQLGDVEQLVDVLDPDDAGLPQHRVERLGRHVGRRGPGDRAGRRSDDTPDFTTMTGLVAASRRAMRENLRGLPIDSR